MILTAEPLTSSPNPQPPHLGGGGALDLNRSTGRNPPHESIVHGLRRGRRQRLIGGLRVKFRRYFDSLTLTLNLGGNDFNRKENGYQAEFRKAKMNPKSR